MLQGGISRSDVIEPSKGKYRLTVKMSLLTVKSIDCGSSPWEVAETKLLKSFKTALENRRLENNPALAKKD